MDGEQGRTAHAGGISTAGILGLACVINLLAFLLLFYYFWNRGDPSPWTEVVRTALVTVLILAMLGFGGFLITRALFPPSRTEPARGNGSPPLDDSPPDGGRGSGSPAQFLTTGGFLMVVIITVLAFLFVFYYFWELNGDFTSPANIRPLLVLTLIVAMLGFGGLLMIRALFADINYIQDRFRLGREVFLVFSGIFGTIIGFYFGAADEAGGGAPTIEVAFAEGRVTAAVAGGAEPFLGIFTASEETGGRVMDVDERVLSYTVPGGQCPDGATIAVVDGRGHRADGTVDCDEEEGEAGDNTATEDTNTATNTTTNTTTNGQ